VKTGPEAASERLCASGPKRISAESGKGLEISSAGYGDGDKNDWFLSALAACPGLPIRGLCGEE